jgi:hypothetical protein
MKEKNPADATTIDRYIAYIQPGLKTRRKVHTKAGK